MRTLIQILTLVFLLQNTGMSGVADAHALADIPHPESAMHSMNSEGHDPHRDCCNLDLAGLVDCALECLSGCSVMNLVDSVELLFSCTQIGHPLLAPDTAYSSLAPPPETPPPLV